MAVNGFRLKRSIQHPYIKMTAPLLTTTGRFSLSQFNKVEIDITLDEYTRFTQVPSTGTLKPIRQYTDRNGATRHTLSLALQPYDARPSELRSLVNRFTRKTVTATFAPEEYSFTTQDGVQRTGWTARMRSIRNAPEPAHPTVDVAAQA